MQKSDLIISRPDQAMDRRRFASLVGASSRLVAQLGGSEASAEERGQADRREEVVEVVIIGAPGGSIIRETGKGGRAASEIGRGGWRRMASKPAQLYRSPLG